MSVAGKTVYIELVAQTKRFNAGMKKAEKGLARVKKAVGLVSAAILVIGAVALRALSKKMDEISGELDSMAKAAKGLQVSFAFLEDVQFAFKRLGGDGSVGTMTKMFKSLEKATAEAMSGSKEYTDLFDLLNINAKEFGNLKQEEKVLAIHRAWSKSNKTTEQAAAMGDILGRGWNKNRAVFAASSEELLRLIDKRRELGGLTAAGGELGESFEDVKANLEQVKRGLSDQIFKALGPSLIKVTEHVTRFVLALRKSGHAGNVVKGVVIAITASMGVATAALITLLAAMSPVAATGFLIVAAFSGIALGLYTVITRWDELTESIKYFFQNFNSLSEGFWDGFGGEVLNVLGFGGGEDTGGGLLNPLAPQTAPGGGGNSTTSNSSTTVNVDARGMTASQVNALIKQAEAQRLRNKGK